MYTVLQFGQKLADLTANIWQEIPITSSQVQHIKDLIYLCFTQYDKNILKYKKLIFVMIIYHCFYYIFYCSYNSIFVQKINQRQIFVKTIYKFLLDNSFISKFQLLGITVIALLLSICNGRAAIFCYRLVIKKDFENV